VLAFSEDEQKEYLNSYNLEETGLNRLIQQAYSTLGLISFLTAGEKEVRAWTIVKGTLAPQAAGTIHTDFEKKFIKADIVTYADFVVAPGWIKSRDTGKVVSAGRDHVMRDGDVVEFKVGA
jgi:ribosome-binding ATPase YchF (GTP1/OBG family)